MKYLARCNKTIRKQLEITRYMKLILCVFFIGFISTAGGQNLKFYDAQGNLAIDSTIKIDLENIECIKLVEDIIIANVSSNLIYPPIAYENDIEGKAVIHLIKQNSDISIKILIGVDPLIDNEILQKTSNIKEMLIDSSICQSFEFYIPFEFKFGDKSCNNDLCISVLYPGEKATLLKSSNAIDVYQFESAYYLSESDLLRIDSLLISRFDSYIKLQKEGMVGIEIVSRREYQKYLKEERDRILTRYNRVYYGINNDENEKTLKIVFSEDGIDGYDVIEYDIKRDRIERYYKTVTY